MQLCDILVHFYEGYQWQSLKSPLAEAVLKVRRLVADYVKNRTHQQHDIVNDVAFMFVMFDKSLRFFNYFKIFKVHTKV